VRISWGKDKSRECNSITYTLWLLRHLIILDVKDIHVHNLSLTAKSDPDIEAIIGKVSDPITVPPIAKMDKGKDARDTKGRFSAKNKDNFL